MPKQIRHRRGTTAQHATFTGAEAEVTYDSDKRCLVLHDGVTQGGRPLEGFVLLRPPAGSTQTIYETVQIPGTLRATSAILTGVGIESEAAFQSGLRCAVTTLPYAASIELSLTQEMAYLELTGNVSFTDVDYDPPGQVVRLMIVAGAAMRTLSFPSGWKWIGGTAPTSIAANKVGLLELFLFTTDPDQILARWSVQS